VKADDPRKGQPRCLDSGSISRGWIAAQKAGNKLNEVGFPPDLIGARSPEHLSVLLASLWALPTHKRESFSGGWRSIPFRPPDFGPQPGGGGGGGELAGETSEKMDPRLKPSQWDRWNSKEARNPPNAWGRHRNMSWRLRPSHVKSEGEVIGSSSGDMNNPGNSKSPTLPGMLEVEGSRRTFCQKCGDEGHHARDCSRALWCDICMKETHVTAKCVWPRQNKPIMPLVGMAADGLSFYSSQFGKNISKKPKRSLLGLVKIVEGIVSAGDLERDFSFHFPWGRPWKADKCHLGFLMQFPSQDRLDELTNFTELKMKISGVKIVVTVWNSQVLAKSRLHSVWIKADNVPEELLNYQAICELGSVLGAVEEVDLAALKSNDMVRFKVHVKSVARIPPVIEIGVKHLLYDIYFKVEKVETEGWNEEEASMRKRSSVDLQPNEFGLGDNGGKKPKSDIHESGKVPLIPVNQKTSSSEFKEAMFATDPQTNECDKCNEEGENLGDENNEKVDFEDSDEDLLSSQELNNFVKGMGVEIADEQELEMDEGELLKVQDEQQTGKDKKGKAKLVDQVEGTRKSSRLEANEDIRITDKAINRAEAKDAFLNIGNNPNPFSILNSENSLLIDIANKLGVNLGKDDNERLDNLEMIKCLEEERARAIMPDVGADDIDNKFAGNLVENEDPSIMDRIVQEMIESESEGKKNKTPKKKKKIQKEKKYSLRKKKGSPKIRYTSNNRRCLKRHQWDNQVSE
jgi:hypothetical protein